MAEITSKPAHQGGLVVARFLPECRAGRTRLRLGPLPIRLKSEKYSHSTPVFHSVSLVFRFLDLSFQRKPEGKALHRFAVHPQITRQPGYFPASTAVESGCPGPATRTYRDAPGSYPARTRIRRIRRRFFAYRRSPVPARVLRVVRRNKSTKLMRKYWILFLFCDGG